MYDYKCQVCCNIRSTAFRQPVECCGVEMKRYLGRAPGTVIAPQHQATKDKMGYYGITNIATGEGITRNTYLDSSPGIDLGTLE